jgi:DNA-binding NarL/FixJ family response regulator
MKPATIIIIDDHAIFRFGLTTALRSRFPEAEILEADSISSEILCLENDPDLILLDIKLPGLNGLDGISLIKRKFSQTPILIISSQDDSETMQRAYSYGAVSFISKIEPMENTLENIHLALQGKFSGSNSAIQTPFLKSLTPRQCEVLNLLHQGSSNKAIAHRLSISESTACLHVRNLLELFKAKSRAEAVFIARDKGLLN